MENVHTMKGKRKRLVLDFGKKLELIKKLDNGFRTSQLAMEYGVGVSTVRDIYKNKDRFKAFAVSSCISPHIIKRKTLKESAFKDLDRALFNWYKCQCEKGISVNGSALVEKALSVHKKLGYGGTFNASSGWLDRFKKRHGIISKEKHVNPVSETPLANFTELAKQRGLIPEQIYIYSEVAFCWKKLLTDKIFEEQGTSGDEDSLAVMCCINITGTHKLPLVCVGTAEETLTSKETEPKTLFVDYYSHEFAMLTARTLRMWFHNKFVPAVTKHLRSRNLTQNAVLLAHGFILESRGEATEIFGGEVFIEYLPIDFFTGTEKTDRNIAETLKCQYRMDMLHSLAEKELDVVTFLNNYTLKDALLEIGHSWEKLKPNNFFHSLKSLIPSMVKVKDEFEVEDGIILDIPIGILNSGHLVNSLENPISYADGVRDSFEIVDCMISDIPSESRVSVDESRDCVGSSVCSEDQISTKHDATEPISKTILTHKEALLHAEKLLEYFEQQEDTLYRDVLELRKLCSNIKKKVNNSSKHQTLITDYLRKK